MFDCFRIVSFLFLFFELAFSSFAQFAPAAGQVGSTAIHKDSSIIVAWAQHCAVQRGPKDISQPHLGLASAGAAHQATGMAGDGLIVSLGDGGQATLTFSYPIQNGPGPDFVVFENAFNATFLELALVEVSSDGQHFVRFPAISNTDTAVQVGGFGNVDPTRIYNLAGKYKANYGTPFDLEELIADTAVLDLNAITHVRLIDVVGSMQPNYASRDSRGVKINDPWSTPFASGGFDLDAVGVLHQNTNISITKIPLSSIQLYPNPIQQGQNVQLELPHSMLGQSLQIYTLHGVLVDQQILQNSSLTTQHLEKGCYLLYIENDQHYYTQKLVVK